jgi:hypothetical protein
MRRNIDFKEFKKRIASKTFDDVLDSIRSMDMFETYESIIKKAEKPEDSRNALGALHSLSILGNDEMQGIVFSVSHDLLYEKADKQLRKEILGKKKEKVKKEEVRKLLNELSKECSIDEKTMFTYMKKLEEM